MKARSFASVFFKIAATLVYEILVIAGIMLFISLLAVLLTPQHQVPPETLWFQLLMLAAITLYLAGSLKMGGQTLGMKAWRLHWKGFQRYSWPKALALTLAALLCLIAMTLGIYRWLA